MQFPHADSTPSTTNEQQHEQSRLELEPLAELGWDELLDPPQHGQFG
jgi:hypothetical protein